MDYSFSPYRFFRIIFSIFIVFIASFLIIDEFYKFDLKVINYDDLVYFLIILCFVRFFIHLLLIKYMNDNISTPLSFSQLLTPILTVLIPVLYIIKINVLSPSKLINSILLLYLIFIIIVEEYFYPRYMRFSKIILERDMYADELKDVELESAKTKVILKRLEKEAYDEELSKTSHEELEKPFSPIINPYRAGPPLRTGHPTYIGRKEEYRDLKSGLVQKSGQCFIVTGERRTGKTSFLYALQDGKLGKNVIPVMIDIQGQTGKSTAGFFRSLAMSIIAAVEFEISIDRQRFYEDPFDEFSLIIDKIESILNNKQILLLIDEFELLQDQINKKLWPVELLDMFRSMIQHRRGFSLVFCGTYNLRRLTGDRWGIFFNIAHTITMDLFSDTEAEALITEPIAKLVLLNSNQVNSIRIFTGCHPYYLQIVCSTLIRHLNREKRYTLIDEDLPLIFKESFEGDLHNSLDYIWESVITEKDFRIIVSLIAGSNPDPASWISLDELASSARSYLNQIELDRILTELEGRQIIKRRRIRGMKDWEVQFKTGIVHRWLRERKPFKHVLRMEK
jgi:hypothetical protein